MRILIKDGNIVTATDNYIADILVADGRIQVIGNDLHKAYQADQTIDAGGMYIFPGGIDAHTHMEYLLWELIALMTLKQVLRLV